MSVFAIDEDGDPAVDYHAVLMTMEAKRRPILVRREPTSKEWCVIVQGPPGVLHWHNVDAFDAAMSERTPFQRAHDIAREHADEFEHRLAQATDRVLRGILMGDGRGFHALFPDLEPIDPDDLKGTDDA